MKPYLLDTTQASLWSVQVLANPTSELQEGTDVSRDQLKAVGIRPYDEKVRRPSPSARTPQSATASTTSAMPLTKSSTYKQEDVTVTGLVTMRSDVQPLIKRSIISP